MSRCFVLSVGRLNSVTLPPFCFSDEEAEQSGRREEPDSRRLRSFPEEELEEDSECQSVASTDDDVYV